MKDEPYHYVAVENFVPEGYEPTSALVRVRPLSGQGVDQNVRVECDRYHMRYDFPLGTVFIIKGKLTDREGGPEFIYSYFGWPYITISRKDAEKLIFKKQIGFFPTSEFNDFRELVSFAIKRFQRGQEV